MRTDGDMVVMSMSDDGDYRVFCAYPQWCGAETYVDEKETAERYVEFHEEHHPNHRADYENTETEQ